ncbi:MAG: hypothetical protein ABI199_04650 [Bacteroidia bacterium]
MRYLISIMIFSIVFFCKKGTDKSIQKNTSPLQIIDFFGDFQMKTPRNWHKFKLQGIDSYIGGITNGRDTLTFDFGPYSDDFSDIYETQMYANDTINGKFGIITKPKIKEKGYVGVYLENVNVGRDRFNLITQSKKNEDVKNEDTIISIFQTIKFKNSDTTKNSQSLKFLVRDSYVR